MMDQIPQVWIALFGLTSAWLVYDRNEKRRRWAPLLALLAQPAWYWSCIAAQQWGVLVLTVFYTWLHFRGFWKLWIEARRREKEALRIRQEAAAREVLQYLGSAIP